MATQELYKDYFDIDPDFYPQVTPALIESGKVNWMKFYPHDTFVKLLDKTCSVLSGKDHHSLWVEGAYGTGKSHAALTVKSILEAPNADVESYFINNKLSMDLCNRIKSVKSGAPILIAHRMMSSDIHSDQDLIIAVQNCIVEAMRKQNITNGGEAALKDAVLAWLSSDINRDYFTKLLSQVQYQTTTGNVGIDELMTQLTSNNQSLVMSAMQHIMRIAKDNGITAMNLDVSGLKEWIKSVIRDNHLKAILFIWDEFTEFLINNQKSLTGFQTLAEMSSECPFYFMIVSHESRSLFYTGEDATKILDRFVDPIKIELPENMALRLMAQAMKLTSDPVLKNSWMEYRQAFKDDLKEVISYIVSNLRLLVTVGNKESVSVDEFEKVLPVHPYAAILLKHLSVAFSSNQRSMFDFILNNDMNDAKGFRYYINTHGPSSTDYILTVDMLWDFMYTKGNNGLNEDVRQILDSYFLSNPDNLGKDEQSVLKTILLLQAISLRMSDVELLRPTGQNLEMAYSGTSWSKGKALNIAEGLVKKNILFKRPRSDGKFDYTIANNASVDSIEKLKEQVRRETTTEKLIDSGSLGSAISLPAKIAGRFRLESVSCNNLMSKATKLDSLPADKEFHVIVAFAMNDKESSIISQHISNGLKQYKNIFFLDTSLKPMGKDIYDRYVENMAYNLYYAQSDKHRAEVYSKQAENCLAEWKELISKGPFMLYSAECHEGLYLKNSQELSDRFASLNHERFPYGLENYEVKSDLYNGTVFTTGAECGITKTLKLNFKEDKIKSELADVWDVDKYWEDPKFSKQPIVQVKLKAEEIIHKGFDSPAGRVAVIDIYRALEEAPYGYRPVSLAAFMMGFILKEYASPNYFWSNGTTSTQMSTEKLKNAIANAMKQTVNPAKGFKLEYIVVMSGEQRAFLECTSAAFGISKDLCGSIESARDQVRICMKNLSFPIWTISCILDDVNLRTPAKAIKDTINAYCGIANNANSFNVSESDLANKIGKLVLENNTLIEDLASLLTSDNCQDGMIAYIGQYQGGILKDLAMEIGDAGNYILRVKTLFTADAANWVWNKDTANKIIDSVILEYKIIKESAKSLSGCNSIRAVVDGWNGKTNNIKIACAALKSADKNLSAFLEELSIMQQTKALPEQRKSKFYNELCAHREEFDDLYINQIKWFKLVAKDLIYDLSGAEVVELYSDFTYDKFLMSYQEYMAYVREAVKKFQQTKGKTILKDLWSSKTGSKDPRAWSKKHKTPILCMVDAGERQDAKSAFATIMSTSPTESEVNKAIAYLNDAHFYSRLDDQKLIDDCFMKEVVGDYAEILTDPEEIRVMIESGCSEDAYDWMNNAVVNRIIERNANVNYVTKDNLKVMAIINEMGTEDLRAYMKELIETNVKVGIEILKKNKKV